MQKIVKGNGYLLQRVKGSHFIYKQQGKGRIIVINKNLNTAVANRIIKENKLVS